MVIAFLVGGCFPPPAPPIKDGGGVSARAEKSAPIVMGIDAGGTMTDTILVDADGGFTIGKAATTPRDESLGFLESAEDAAAEWGLRAEEMYPHLRVALYSGTGMLNTLLARAGKRLGLIVTRGMEDAVLMGRGLQAWADYSYSDRLHAVTHNHPPPLVPRGRVFGVTERVDQFGAEVIPVYEKEAELAAVELLNENVDAICVCTLFSHVNPAHELQIAAAAENAARERGADVAVYCSHKIRPVVREQSRLNSVLIEAYACAGGRRQLLGIEKAVRARGFKHQVHTVLSYGGLASVRHPRLHETMVSGPIGGILGAQHIGEALGEESLIVSDMGGTSFDMGVITRGQVRMENEPLLGRFKLNAPTIAMDYIGAGAGMVVKVDPLTKKASLGPESAGADPGPVCFDRGGEMPTVCDCDLILGRLNPDYFLGGKVKLNTRKAEEALRRDVADVIGADLHFAAEGMTAMLEAEANSALRRILSSQGVHPSEFVLLSYGGSGPLHLSGYARGIGFKDIITFPFAAAFSAFGCTTADYMRRHSRSVHLDISSAADDDELLRIAGEIDSHWHGLEKLAREEMTNDGHDPAAVSAEPFLMMRYRGQLEDVEVPSPVRAAKTADDARAIIAEFERIYDEINRKVSRYGDAGYSVMELGVIARAEKVKPRLVRRALESPLPKKEADKGKRKVFFDGCWRETQLWEMNELLPGNRIIGPAVVEHSATTLIVAPGDDVCVDEWTLFHYRYGGAKEKE